jgi:hypothetical protein
MKKRFVVVFDCLVMDEPYIKFIEANDADECWEIAYPISMRQGLRQGNFTIYQEVTE